MIVKGDEQAVIEDRYGFDACQSSDEVSALYKRLYPEVVGDDLSMSEAYWSLSDAARRAHVRFTSAVISHVSETAQAAEMRARVAEIRKNTDPADVRQWAKDHGLAVEAKGRLKPEWWIEYAAAREVDGGSDE